MRNKFFFILILVLSFGLLNAPGQEKQKPKVINGGVINGKATKLPKPEYPAAALAVKASGTVKVQVMIDEIGNVFSATAVSGHPLLRQAAENAALQSAFQPTTLSGQSVRVTGIIVYNFVAPKNSPTNEEKLMMMGLGAFLTFANFLPSDEWEILKKEELVEVPQIAKELEPLTLINKQTGKEKRAEIIERVIVSLENKLTGVDAWQFRFGREFGALLLEIGKGGGEIADRDIDETAVKTRLITIRDSMFAAPDDFPPDVSNNLKEIIKFADVPNLNSEENKLRLVKLLSETLDVISPDFVEK